VGKRFTRVLKNVPVTTKTVTVTPLTYKSPIEITSLARVRKEQQPDPNANADLDFTIRPQQIPHSPHQPLHQYTNSRRLSNNKESATLKHLQTKQVVKDHRIPQVTYSPIYQYKKNRPTNLDSIERTSTLQSGGAFSQTGQSPI